MNSRGITFLLTVSVAVMMALGCDQKFPQNGSGGLAVSSKPPDTWVVVGVDPANHLQLDGDGGSRNVSLRCVRLLSSERLRAHVKEHWLGKTVTLELDRTQEYDEEGNWSVYVFRGTEMLNKELIEMGIAEYDVSRGRSERHEHLFDNSAD